MKVQDINYRWKWLSRESIDDGRTLNALNDESLNDVINDDESSNGPIDVINDDESINDAINDDESLNGIIDVNDVINDDESKSRSLK